LAALLVLGTLHCGAGAETSADPAWLPTGARAGFEIDALAETLKTPEAAFAFVRDQIAYEPYRGVMKGAAGALLTRGGNDCDRALLLAQLLAAQNVEVRIVRGSLSPAAARALLDHTLRSAGAADRLLASLPRVTVKPPETFAQRVQWQLFEQHIADRSRLIAADEAEQHAILSAALPSTPAPVPLEAPLTHVWVQATVGEKPVDFAPCLTAAKIDPLPGEVTDAWEINSLPDELYHTLTIAVVAEMLHGDQLEREELLSHEFRAADRLGRGLRVAVVPTSPAKNPGTYRPLIFAGGELITGSAFCLTGPPAAASSSGAGGLLGGFGGGTPTEAKDVSANDPGAPRLARLRIEVRFHAPDVDDETVSRVFFDRVEPKADRWRLIEALADDKLVRGLLVQAWDAALDVGAPHPLAIMTLEQDAITGLEKARAVLAGRGALSAGDLPNPSPAPQLLYYFLASALEHRAIGGAQTRVIHLRPRLAFLRHGFAIADWTRIEPHRLRYEEGIDLCNAPFRFLGASGHDPRVAQRAGIADTALERFVLHRAGQFNTIPMIAAAKAEKIDLVTVRESAQLAPLSLPPAIRAVLDEELAHGHALLMPASPVRLSGTHVFGWWSVDPATGYAIGRMELGGAQALVEKGETEEKVSEWTEEYAKIMGNALECYEGEIKKALKEEAKSIVFGGEGGKMPGGDEMVSCLRSAICDALKDFATGKLNAAFPAREEKLLKDIFANWLREKAVDKAGDAANAGCETLLGGGGK
jgi:hypothetical protein